MVSRLLRPKHAGPLALMTSGMAFVLSGCVLSTVRPGPRLVTPPVTIREAGSYKLGPGPVSVCSTAIVVECSNVSIDLDGRMLQGPGTFESVGILIRDARGRQIGNVSVGNGGATCFGNGVALWRASECSFLELRVVANLGQGISFLCPDGTQTASNSVTQCSVVSNGAHGIGWNGDPRSALPGAKGVTMRENSVSETVAADNGGVGVLFWNEGGAVVENVIEESIVRGNGMGGIEMKGRKKRHGAGWPGADPLCLRNVIRHCVVTGNKREGVELVAPSGCVVSNCIVSGNRSCGIMLDAAGTHAKGNKILGCQISGNAWVGIVLDGIDQSVVRDCVVTGNKKPFYQKGSCIKGVAVTNALEQNVCDDMATTGKSR